MDVNSLRGVHPREPLLDYAPMAMRCALLVGVLILASCAGQGTSHEDGPGSAGRVESGDTAGGVPKGAFQPELRPATASEILDATRGSGSQAVLVNVWATWCAPCRAEFPDLVRLHRDYRGRGLALVLVSADFEEQLPEARAFLAKSGVDFPSFYKVGDDMQFINTLNPKWTGALPATFIYDSEGRQRYFQEGRGTYKEFEKQVLEVLNSKGGSSKGEPS